MLTLNSVVLSDEVLWPPQTKYSRHWLSIDTFVSPNNRPMLMKTPFLAHTDAVFVGELAQNLRMQVSVSCRTHPRTPAQALRSRANWAHDDFPAVSVVMTVMMFAAAGVSSWGTHLLHREPCHRYVFH